MLSLRLMEQLRERRLLAKRAQPRIVRHDRIAEEAARDDAFEERQRLVWLAEVGRVAGEIEEPLRIPEVRRSDASNRGEAVRRVALEQARAATMKSRMRVCVVFSSSRRTGSASSPRPSAASDNGTM